MQLTVAVTLPPLGFSLFLDPDDIPVAEVGEINASIRSSLTLYKSPEDVTLKENFLNGV